MCSNALLMTQRYVFKRPSHDPVVKCSKFSGNEFKRPSHDPEAMCSNALLMTHNVFKPVAMCSNALLMTQW
ncbi:hypothetical protein CEXT_305391 [Caerostris extrusa]|uniref:Uncharacterized protein n=1 Tax=Caerostris extrusa TaxID=172846 RepID=A0AAV4P5S1_CAEEX|nr:hypothetical protein CEXT_305391 [Caerostris extrusa]